VIRDDALHTVAANIHRGVTLPWKLAIVFGVLAFAFGWILGFFLERA
jgi:hypothetical protein